MLAIKTILHPTDFSEGSDIAFRLACSLARDYGARLIVLHVAAPPEGFFYGEGIIPLPPKNHREPLHEKLLLVQPRHNGITVEHRLAEGDAVAEILQEAEAEKADVIVMGTHGRTGVGRLVMGSVAEQVVRRAACPVVTVKPQVLRARAAEQPQAAVAPAKG